MGLTRETVTVIKGASMGKEATLQSKIIKYLEKRGCYVIKTGGMGTPNGCPDIIALADGGGFFALEVKASKTAKFQPLQKQTIERLDDMYYATAVYPENWEQIKSEIEMHL
jgi:Holliday junction resolvase